MSRTLPDYRDIYAAVGDLEPLWHDYSGCPRFAPFEPDLLGVYDSYALLAQISCQSCRRMFNIGVGWSRFQLVDLMATGDSDLLSKLADGFKFGDPPIHSCGGDSMNSASVRILEAWERVRQLRDFPKWQRVAEVEQTEIMQPWAVEDGRWS